MRLPDAYLNPCCFQAQSQAAIRGSQLVGPMAMIKVNSSNHPTSFSKGHVVSFDLGSYEVAGVRARRAKRRDTGSV